MEPQSSASMDSTGAVKNSYSMEEIDDWEGEDCSSSYSDISLLSLPWEQVLCRNVLPYISIPQLFRLRTVSHSCLCLVDTYFSLQFHLNICHLGKKLTSTAFSLMTRDSRCLKSLLLRGAKYGLTNDVFLPVLSNNARLEKIDISGCTSLSGCVLYAIGVNCPNLKQLILRDCVTFMEENFLSFLCVKQPVHLEYLDISGCWNLGDDLLIKLVQRCPSIKHLLLGNLYGLTDRSVCAISHSCPGLVSLSLVGCWRITDHSISLVAAYCPDLKLLDVKECRDITEDSLGPLRKRQVKIDKPGPPPSYLDRLEFLNRAHKINVML